MLLVLAAALEVLADFCLKTWANVAPWVWLASGVALYSLSVVAWAAFLRSNTLQRGVILFAASNLLTGLLVGRFCFGEAFSPRGLTAALLTLAAIVLMGGF